MKQEDVQVGQFYLTKVSERLTKVKVVRRFVPTNSNVHAFLVCLEDEPRPLPVARGAIQLMAMSERAGR